MQVRGRGSVPLFGESQQDRQEQGQESLMLRLAGQVARACWLSSVIIVREDALVPPISQSAHEDQ